MSGLNLGFRIDPDGMLVHTRPELIEDTQLVGHRMRPATAEEAAMWEERAFLLAVEDAADWFYIAVDAYFRLIDLGIPARRTAIEEQQMKYENAVEDLAAFRAAKEEQAELAAMSSYNGWYDYACDRLGFTPVEAAEYATRRVVEAENRKRLRHVPEREFDDAA